MMKRCFFYVNLFLFSHYIFCNPAPKLDTTFAKLLAEVEKGSVFEQLTFDDRCPKAFTLIFSDEDHYPKFAKPGDRKIYLLPIEPSSTWGFTHERNFILFRPGLSEGKLHTHNRDITFISLEYGLMYTESSQIVKEGSLTWNYLAKVLNRNGTFDSKSFVTYDSKAQSIHYFYSAKGIKDVNCYFLIVD